MLPNEDVGIFPASGGIVQPLTGEGSHQVAPQLPSPHGWGT